MLQPPSVPTNLDTALEALLLVKSTFSGAKAPVHSLRSRKQDQNRKQSGNVWCRICKSDMMVLDKTTPFSPGRSSSPNWMMMASGKSPRKTSFSTVDNSEAHFIPLHPDHLICSRSPRPRLESHPEDDAYSLAWRTMLCPTTKTFRFTPVGTRERLLSVQQAWGHAQFIRCRVPATDGHYPI